MGSSFMIAINIALAVFCVSHFVKYIIQFGLPNHPSRFTLYLSTICVCAFFVLTVMAEMELISAIDFLRWRALPVVAGSLCLLLQIVTSMGQFSLIQQKIVSRIPLIGALLFFAIFPSKADVFLKIVLVVCVLFLTVSVGKARYQKRALLKMVFFLLISFLLSLSLVPVMQVFARLLLFPALFYFFVFEQSYGVAALLDQHYSENSGVSS